MSKNIFRMMSAGWLLLFATGSGLTETRKIAPDLMVDAKSTVDVIVMFHHAPGTEQHEKVLARGGGMKSGLGSMKAAAYRIPAASLADLAADPEVEYIAPDRPLHGSLDTAAAAINADVVKSYGFTGAGIGVAVIDSGISKNPDMTGARVVYEESFTATPGFYDQYGHGTHVAGIIGGTGVRSSGLYAGIAPGVRIVNLRVLDQNGAGTDSAVIAAIQRAIQLKSTYNIRIINLSLGRQVFESYQLDPLCQAAEAAWKAGLVVVAAAGNEGRNNSAGTHGYGAIASPGNDPYVITVGAMKTMGTRTRLDDLIASYSSKGPTAIDHIVKPDVVAPGNRVVSVLDRESGLMNLYPGNVVGNFYFTLSGTSMATPMVSGAAALLIEAQPQLTPDQIKARLMKSASKTFPVSSVATDPSTGQLYTSFYDVFTVGAGYLDVAAALASDNPPAGFALSPTAVYHPDTVSITIEQTKAPGATQVIWGSQVIWGAQVIWGTQVIWGDQVIWADQVIWGSQVIWGDCAGSRDGADPVRKRAESITVAINGEG